MKTLNVIQYTNIDGMVAMGFCECDQKLTTKCDSEKHKHCVYAKGQRTIERRIGS